MARINIYSEPDDYDGSKVLEGWFDPDKAACYKQDTRWNGNNNVGVITGSQWIDEYLYRTSGGRWVLNRDEARYCGGPDTYRFVSDEQAHDWLLRSECNDDAVAKWFGQVEEERGPGRPVIGPEVKFRLAQEQADAVDKMAEAAGVSRSEMLRRLIDTAMACIRIAPDRCPDCGGDVDDATDGLTHCDACAWWTPTWRVESSTRGA